MRKAAGLLVEIPRESPEMPGQNSRPPLGDADLPDMELPSEARLNVLEPRSVEDIVREAQGPNLDEVQVDETQISAAPLNAPGGILSGETLDFSAIYRAANLAPNAFGAEQMLETLQSLPAELPLETRRATVRAMLSTLGKATGATPESVVADASRKLAALESFESYMARKTSDAIAKNDAEIAELELQIDAKREAIQKIKGELLKVQTGCEAESDRLDDVLEFFSLDVGASKYAPSTEQTST
ncbi:hypothetical protein B1R32_1068 [Abditibacterium utsteinense]|uniref:Uncharacterized protein n=2 Tax=Abditibacterium utsteinense TaxID=1960156 RepID=A0A2S8STN4_9BACT|nr:hypothetical protein B1R32_1068 [Abditibacterium utsteinense]